MLLNAEHEMSTFDSQSQSIPVASVRDQEIMIDRLLELRSKMQHKRRSRLQDSLLSNTLVSLTLELKCLVSSHPHLTLFLCFDGNYILKFQKSLLLIVKNERNDAVVWSNHCPHMFHRDCLVSWLLKDRKASCPCCRQRFISPENNKIEPAQTVPLHSLLPIR